jgi:hypothetical protein
MATEMWFVFLCVLCASIEAKTKLRRKSSRRESSGSRQATSHSLILAKLQVGVVLNFGLERIKEWTTRIVNGLPE